MTNIKNSLISGAKSRKYRQRLASYSNKPEKSMLTLKFKLDTQNTFTALGERNANFEDYTNLYNEIEGVQKGSLTHLLFSVILSGFRLFPNSSSAKNFVREQRAKSELSRSLKIDLDCISLSTIKTHLKVIAKAHSKDATTSETVKEELLNKLITVQNDKIESAKTQMAETISTKFKKWDQAGQNAEEITTIIFDKLAALSKSKPLASVDLPPTFPKSSDIAFDMQADISEVNEVAPYMVVAKILSMRDPHIDKAESDFIKENLTTFNNNALSWLYGTGLKFLKESSVNDICKAYGIPEVKTNAAVLLKDAAQALPEVSTKFITKVTGLNNFRSCFGGHIDSWVSNYVSRLKELNELLSKIPDNLTIPKDFLKNNKDFVEYSGLKRDELELLIAKVTSTLVRQNVKDALGRLLGKEGLGHATEYDVKTLKDFSGVINRLGAVRESLENTMNQAEEDKNSEWTTLKKDCNKEWEIWTLLKKLPKLNSLNGGVPLVEDELFHTARLLSELKICQEQYYERLMQWVKANNPNHNPFATVVRYQQELLSKRPNTKADPQELAVRLFLQKIGSTIRRNTDKISQAAVHWFAKNDIFENKKDFNRYFCNRLGSIYVSPFSKRNNQGYALTSNIKDRGNELLQSFEMLIDQLQKKLETECNIENTSEQNTILQLTTLLRNFHISGIQEKIPTELARPILPTEALSEDPLSASLKISLEANKVEARTVSSIYTTVYKSLISGCYTVLNRDRFFLRTKFQWIKNHSLYYVPKTDASWILPERYLKNDKWRRFIEDKALVMDLQRNVDIKATFENIANDSEGKYGELLVQLPHDWYYQLPIATKKTDKMLPVLEISKDNYIETEEKKHLSQTLLETKNFTLTTAARLIGPSSYKSRLDEILISNKSTTVSEMTLLVDQPVKQRIDSTGGVNLTYEDPIFSLAVPIRREATITDSPAPFKHIVAIDQGEAGIAYAVFNIEDAGNDKATPLTTGTIRIPSIRRLIKKVNTFRKKKSTTQKFSQRFDSTMFNMRKNVVGDVCGLIVGLMQKYNAFPILEKDVRNLESGSKQLMLVYKAVNARFLRSDVDMQNSDRGSWWFNPSKYCNWRVPLLRELGPNTSVEKKKQITIGNKQYRELFVYPGDGVRAGGTSQICSCCGRNAFALLKQILAKDPKRKFHINSKGETTIEGEIVKLYHKPNSGKTLVPGLKKHKTYHALNERAPWTETEIECEVDSYQLSKLIKANMRRAPKSLMSKDTSQSRYFCVFKDCKWHNQEHHADINAAINIGRRFLSEVILDPTKELN